MILCHYAQIKHTQQVATSSCSMTGIPTWNLRTWCTPHKSACAKATILSQDKKRGPKLAKETKSLE